MNALHSCLAAATLLSCALGAQAAGSLILAPSSTSVGPGDSFAVEVRGSGFTDNVVGGGFDLGFDANVLTLSSVSVDTVVWEFISSDGSIDNSAGTLADVYFNSFKSVLPTGDFAVATLQFVAKAGGSSALQLAGNASFPFANDLAEVISVDYGSGRVNVSAVPEPATLGLWAAGLMALGLRRLQRTPRGAH
jgi:Cohesin domain